MRLDYTRPHKPKWLQSIYNTQGQTKITYYRTYLHINPNTVTLPNGNDRVRRKSFISDVIHITLFRIPKWTPAPLCYFYTQSCWIWFSYLMLLRYCLHIKCQVLSKKRYQHIFWKGEKKIFLHSSLLFFVCVSHFVLPSAAANS